MAVELSILYKEIIPEHDVHLLTTNCFDKKIDWVHMVENVDFVSLLHGDELVFNSGLNNKSDENRKDYIDRLIEVDAGGLIVALQEGHEFSHELIEYCNSLCFPLFQAGWETSYLKIMRRFSEILLSNERNEMNFIAALKNAIYYPQNEHMYLPAFERNGFFSDMTYLVMIISCENSMLTKQVRKDMHRMMKRSVSYEENEHLVMLCVNYTLGEVTTALADFHKKHPDIYIGIGTQEKQASEIYRSYKNANTTFRLMKKLQDVSMLHYDELGIYQILSDVKEPTILYPSFVQKTLGDLYEYDQKHRTDYMDILKLFFENDCSITQTANATFYHQNTLKYKVKAIKEILGYDIMSNENRVKIMISLYLMQLGKDFFTDM
ncbi:MAG: PucR family transcriptional regulator ligand-binding domain-containing protein [Clostridia bacterium]|nr:PucR family transcriptional regulator ligand-binding domain-containing protein [Clostridia bacterium]